MRIFFLLLLCTAFACGSLKQTGTSILGAITVKSIGAEYEYVRNHYPSHKVVGQHLVYVGKKYYDQLDLVDLTGNRGGVRLYFDINSFYGKKL